jgi:hypothetical protein
MRRDAAAYAMMSDPDHNREFSRGWRDPPDADSRTRRPGQTGDAQIGRSNYWKPADDNEPDLAAQARTAAAALFAGSRP